MKYHVSVAYCDKHDIRYILLQIYDWPRWIFTNTYNRDVEYRNTGIKYSKYRIIGIKSQIWFISDILKGPFKKDVTQKRAIFDDLPTYLTIDLLLRNNR